MRNRISLRARALSLAGLLASGVSPLSSAAQGDTPSAERALLGKTDAPFGVSAANAPRILDGTRALLGREAEVSAPVVRDDQSRDTGKASPAIRTIAVRVSADDGERALLGRSTRLDAGRPGQSGGMN